MPVSLAAGALEGRTGVLEGPRLNSAALRADLLAVGLNLLSGENALKDEAGLIAGGVWQNGKPRLHC